MAKKVWTQEEDQAIFEAVAEDSVCLKHTFEVLATRLRGRNAHTIANRWYSKVSKRPDATCFVTVSKNRKQVNRRRSEGEIIENTEIWDRILTILNLQ